MKYSLIAAAVALASISTVSTSVIAQDAPPYEHWVGGFTQYYSPDSGKSEELAYQLDDGHTYGLEMGFRFDPQWAVRFELSRIFLDIDDASTPLTGDDGILMGADAVYFLEDDSLYAFGGIREMSVENSYRSISYGLGKHWGLSDNLKVITELAGYRDFGGRFDDFSMKLGLAYVFGNTNSGSPARQKDSDNDGVYDAVDRCPASPMGQAVDATGCSIDLDGDGVLNNVDQCPATPAGTKVSANGCAIKDADMDGVIDANDSCPNTPAGTTVNAKGCAADLDLDNDGVLDAMDKCSDTPMTDKVDEQGCSVLVEKEVAIEIDVLFANNSSIIRNPASAEIMEFVDFMKRYGNASAVIEGHTSSVGDADYNQYLSEKRAQSVKQLFTNRYNIEAERLQAIGYGETQLKDKADTPEAHAANRRIEVKVTAKVKTAASR